MKYKISVTRGFPSHPFFNDRDHEYPIKIYYRQESNPFLLSFKKNNLRNVAAYAHYVISRINQLVILFKGCSAHSTLRTIYYMKKMRGLS